MAGAKTIETSKLLFWCLTNPKATWTKTKSIVRHHIITPYRLMKVDYKLAKSIFKDAKGRKFTELEKKKLQAIGSDLLRFVPFSFFLLVPALEILLPVYLYTFPNAKPGWFESRDDKDLRQRRKLETRVEMVKFLKATLETYELKKIKQSDTSLSQSC
jgi:LETM1 and EF-hand domain-containing protein 1